MYFQPFNIDDSNCYLNGDLYYKYDRYAQVLLVPKQKSGIINLMKMSEQGDPLGSYYEMADSELLKIQIRQSRIIGSGKGLFAIQDVASGEFIVEYYGSIMHSKNSNDEQFWLQDKMVQIDAHYCVISRGPASRANDIVKWEPQRYKNDQMYNLYRKKRCFPLAAGAHYNAKITIVSKQKVFLSATKDIPAGEEIHIQYGFDYWDFFYQQEGKGI